MKPLYRAYGLSIDSELELVELQSAGDSDPVGEVDVQVRLRRAPRHSASPHLTSPHRRGTPTY